MTCAEAERRIARLSNEATAAADLSAHIDCCANCRETLQEQQQVSRLLTAMGSDPVPADFVANVRARIDSLASLFNIADWRRWTLRLAPLAVGLVLLAGSSMDRTSGTRMSLETVMQQWTASEEERSSALYRDASTDMLLYLLLEGERPLSLPAGESHR